MIERNNFSGDFYIWNRSEVGFTDVFIHFKSKVCVDGPTEVCNPPICADGPRTILNPNMANDFMSGEGAVPIGPRILGNEGNAGLTIQGVDIVEFDGQNSTFVDWRSIMNDPFNLNLIANAKEIHFKAFNLLSLSPWLRDEYGVPARSIEL